MDILQTIKPRISRRSSDSRNNHTDNGHHVNIKDTTEKLYTVDEVFSRLEKNLNDFYGTNYKLE